MTTITSIGDRFTVDFSINGLNLIDGEIIEVIYANHLTVEFRVVNSPWRGRSGVTFKLHAANLDQLPISRTNVSVHHSPEPAKSEPIQPVERPARVNELYYVDFSLNGINLIEGETLIVKFTVDGAVTFGVHRSPYPNRIGIELTLTSVSKLPIRKVSH